MLTSAIVMLTVRNNMNRRNAEKAQRQLPAWGVSKREVAAHLKVSERTVDNWVAEKKIPRLRLSNRLTRFNLSRVEAALARFEVKEVGALR